MARRSIDPNSGRLLGRPTAPTELGGTGLMQLGFGAGRDGLIYVPATYSPDHPAPLVLMLHGAGGNAHHSLAPFASLADEAGTILIAPESRIETWDVLYSGFGPDVEFIERAMALVFSRYAVDQAHLAVEGFSDGASYALSVGITNGDLFTHIIAFSPGFMAPATQRGAPKIYISHGTHDRVLPIDVCSRRLVPQLERAGYDVTYEEFDGGHTVPPNVAREAMDWFLAS